MGEEKMVGDDRPTAPTSGSEGFLVKAEQLLGSLYATMAESTEMMTSAEINSLAQEIIECLRLVPTLNFFSRIPGQQFVDYRLHMFPLLYVALSLRHLQQPLLDHGALSILKLWLNPLGDKTLGHLQTRTSIIERLLLVPFEFDQHVQREQLKSSGLGKVLVYSSKTSRDDRNEKASKDLVDKWHIEDDLRWSVTYVVPDAKEMNTEAQTGDVCPIKHVALPDMIEAGLIESTYTPDSSLTEEEEEDDRSFTEEEDEVYCNAVNESGGFDVPCFGDEVFGGFGMIRPIVHLELYIEILTRYTKAAIQEKCPDLKFLRILKSNRQCIRGFNFYITFEAEDASGEIKTYQVMIVEGIGDEEIKVEVFREKPT